MKRAVFNAVGKVMGNENLGKVFYDNESKYGGNENSTDSNIVSLILECTLCYRFCTHNSAIHRHKKLCMVKCCIRMYANQGPIIEEFLLIHFVRTSTVYSWHNLIYCCTLQPVPSLLRTHRAIKLFYKLFVQQNIARTF